MGEKAPLWIDLDTGICGTFVEYDPDSKQERGYVIPIIVPLGSIFPRKIKYRHSIPLQTIYDVNSAVSHDGVEKQIKFVFSGKEGSMVQFIDARNIERINMLEQMNKDLRIQLASVKQLAEDSSTGANKSIANARQMLKDSKPENPVSQIFDDYQSMR